MIDIDDVKDIVVAIGALFLISGWISLAIIAAFLSSVPLAIVASVWGFSVFVVAFVSGDY